MCVYTEHLLHQQSRYTSSTQIMKISTVIRKYFHALKAVQYMAIIMDNDFLNATLPIYATTIKCCYGKILYHDRQINRLREEIENIILILLPDLF